MKKIWMIGIIVIISLSFIYAENEIDIIVNDTVLDTFDKEQEMNTPAFIYHNRTMLPMRMVFNIYGIDNDMIYWDAEERKVYVSIYYNHRLEISIDSNEIRYDDETIYTDVPAKIFDNRTYLPLAVISKILGDKALWNAEDRTVTIHPNRYLLEPYNLKLILDRKLGFDVPIDYNGGKLLKNQKLKEKIYITRVANEWQKVNEYMMNQYYINLEAFSYLFNDIKAVYSKINNEYIILFEKENEIYLMKYNGDNLQLIKDIVRNAEGVK